MASGSSHQDVSDQFQKMGEKLGWFKHGDLDNALKSLSRSTKKKKTTKSRIKEKDKNDEHKKEEKRSLVSKSVNGAKPKVPVVTKTSVLSSWRKTELSGFLSSDSDSSFTTVSETLSNNKRLGNKVIQVCSDSEGEEEPKEDTYISCIGESALGITTLDCEHRRSGSFPCRPPNRKTIDSADYDESILRNRMSITSMSIDLDGIGEPLVESTRIHRRSSVTYKQLMGSPEGDDSSTTSGPSLDKVNTGNQRPGSGKYNLKTVHENLCDDVDKLHIDNINREVTDFNDDPDIIGESPDVSPVKNVLYVTALENLDDLEITKVKDKVSSDNEESGNKTDTSSCSSNEYIEVIDTATQTSEPETADDDFVRSPVCHMYADKTLNCPTSPMAYAENTFICSFGESRRQIDTNKVTLTDPQDAINDQSTVSSIGSTELSETENSNSIYSRITVDQTHTNNKYTEMTRLSADSVNGSIQDRYDEITVDRTDENIRSDYTSSQITVDITDVEENESAGTSTDTVTSDSDNSVYEVVDVATQTERTGDDDGYNNSDETTAVVNSEDMSGIKENKIVTDGMENSMEKNAEDSSTSELSCPVIKHKPKQKASHCFDLSSDSDSDIEADSTENPENSSTDVSHNSPDKATVDKDSDLSNINNSSPDKGTVNEDSDVSSNADKSIPDNNAVSNDSGSSDISGRSPDNVSVDKDSGDDAEDMGDTSRETDDHGSDSDPVIFHKVTTCRNRVKAPVVDESERQSWRDSKVFDSESSDDDNLEAFFQKMKKPEKKKSPDSSPQSSMEDFIVEDDDMSSESDGKEFYLRENQKLEKTPLIERLKTNRGISVKNSESEDSSDDVFSSKLYPSSVTKHKQKKKVQRQKDGTCNSLFFDSSDSEDELLNKPNEGNGMKGKSKSPTMNNSPDSDTESPLFKTPNPIRRHQTITSEKKKDRPNNFKPKSTASFTDYISLSDDDITDDDDSLPSLHTSTSNKENIPNTQTPVKTKPINSSDIFTKMPTPLSKLKTPGRGDSGRGSNYCSFLKSLSPTTEEHRRNPDAAKFVRNFRKAREDLVKHLFNLYNVTIFDKRLPVDLSIIWNKRLLKTAGYCAYRCNRKNKEDRTARIELSTKVCDSAERVRDTLIHELCHAAVWLLNGVNGGHGNFWRYWARHASKVHPELPAISRCHSYSINTKFTYKCSRCGYSIGRHSKSLDTTKKVCGYCKGTFELLQNATPMTPRSASSSVASSVGCTPRTPNRFAMFVKDNYNTVKQKNKDLKHGDVMKELSRQFAASKINT